MTAVADRKRKPASWERFRGLLGLATRAGQTIFGTERCLEAARSGEAALLAAEENAAAATLEKLKKACDAGGISLLCVPADTIQLSAGRPGIVAGVRPGGLAEGILELSAQLKAEHQPEREIMSGGKNAE